MLRCASSKVAQVPQAVGVRLAVTPKWAPLQWAEGTASRAPTVLRVKPCRQGVATTFNAMGGPKARLPPMTFFRRMFSRTVTERRTALSR